MNDINHPHADHDDGLVHAHAWARAEPPPHAVPQRTEPDHDDGLVHDHGWARSERVSACAAE